MSLKDARADPLGHTASTEAAPQQDLRSGQPAPPDEAPKFDNAQYARSSSSRARADLMISRNLDAGLSRGGNLSPQDLASTLHGTWLRRLTQHGLPVETDSYLVFDMADPAKGTAMMIDRETQNEYQRGTRPERDRGDRKRLGARR